MATRNDDGTVTGPKVQQSTGNGPFGMTFTQRNQLITTENSVPRPAWALRRHTRSTSGPAPSRRRAPRLRTGSRTRAE